MVWIFFHTLGTLSSQLTKSIILQRGRPTTKQKICIALLNWVNLGWVVKWSTQQLFCFKVSEIAHVKTHEIHSLHLRILEQCSNMFKLCWLMILRSCANVPNIFKISRIRYGNPYLPTSNVEWRCGFSNPSPVHNHHSSQVELRPSCHGPRRGELPWHNRILEMPAWNQRKQAILYYCGFALSFKILIIHDYAICIYAGVYLYCMIHYDLYINVILRI